MLENGSLRGKNILVTGGSLGLGYASAAACLNAGANVLICARDASNLTTAIEQLCAIRGPGALRGISADVTRLDDVERALDELEAEFGPLTSTIHAAGIYGPIGKLTNLSATAWIDTLRINLFGSFIVARQSCLRLMKHGGGRIVLYSGGGAAAPFPNYSAYASSKAAVARFTETIAIEMAPFGIEINCVSPGFVVTRLHEQTLAARDAAGDEFFEKTRNAIAQGGVPASVGADACIFLISDSSRGITGKFLAAPYDGWSDWPQHLTELRESDVFTLRRILPSERDMNWQ